MACARQNLLAYFHRLSTLDRITTLDTLSNSPRNRVADVVRRLLTERSISGTVGSEDDLREAGLTSLDMVNLMLSIEAEFDLEIPEIHIIPANFRSISTINRLVTTLMKNS